MRARFFVRGHIIQRQFGMHRCYGYILHAQTDHTSAFASTFLPLILFGLCTVSYKHNLTKFVPSFSTLKVGHRKRVHSEPHSGLNTAKNRNGACLKRITHFS